MLKIGTTEITKLYIGSNELEKAYLGSTLIYDKVAPTTTAIITVTAGTGISSVTGGGEYVIGTDASVGATVSSGYQFKHWAESSTPGTGVSTDNPYTFTVTADRELTAIGESTTPGVPYDEIWYTTSDGNAITLAKQSASDWGSTVLSNTYSSGKGIIKFNGNVTKLGQQVLDAKTTLTSISIPDCITEFGNYAMRGCTALTSITIPENVTSIGQQAWGGCTSLTTINYNATNATCAASGTSSIPFKDIPNIATINVGANVTHFGKNLFGVNNSKPMYGTMNLYSTTPPICGNSATIPDPNNITSIVVPASAVDTYKTATNWSKCAAKITGRS